MGGHLFKNILRLIILNLISHHFLPFISYSIYIIYIYIYIYTISRPPAPPCPEPIRLAEVVTLEVD